MDNNSNLEEWDLMDGNRRPLGRRHQRGKPMKPGEYHAVVGIWAVNLQNDILLTLRASEKTWYPNVWENTGGSVLAGETSRQAAVRELYEETGIIVDEEAVIFLGSAKEQETFADTYIVRADIPKDNVRLQPGETIDAKWVTLFELNQMMERGEIVPPAVSQLLPIREKFERFLKNKPM